MMPRQKDPIWSDFTEINRDGSQRAQCNLCEEDVAPLVARMKNHVDNHCKRRMPEEVTPAKKMKQTTLGLVSTGPNKQHAINLQLTRYLIATNTAFIASENAQLRKLFDILRPGTAIPDRKTIAGPLLEEVFDEEKKKTVNKVKSLKATLALDGWSNVTNDPIVGISFIASGESYLVNTIDISGESHTSEYFLSLLADQVSECETDWGIKITSVVTDNAANVAGMRTAFNAKGVHTYGCQAHILNLLAKDIALSKNNKAVNAKITSIIKFLRNTHSASSALKAKKLPRPLLYTEFRWNSLKETLEYFTLHWPDTAVIANASLKPRDQIYRYMEEVSIKRAATDQLAILDPVGEALNKVQSDKCLLDVREIWRDLKNAIPDEYQAEVSTREQQSLSGVFFAANLLDLRYKGEALCPAEVQAAVAYIHENNEEVGVELTKYLANHPPYLKSALGNIST